MPNANSNANQLSSQSAAAEAYRRATFETAPPIKIVRLMYQGALRFLDEAIALDPAADYATFQDRLRRAEAVIVELRASLEHARAPVICGDLEQLYLFAEDALAQAQRERDVEPLHAARGVLATLFEAWRELELRDVREEAA